MPFKINTCVGFHQCGCLSCSNITLKWIICYFHFMWRNGMCYFHLNKRRLSCKMAQMTNATHLLVWKEPTATIFIPKNYKSKRTCEKVAFWSEEIVVGIIGFNFGWPLCFSLLGERSFVWLLETFLMTICQTVSLILFYDHWLCYKYIQTQWPSYPSCNNHILRTWHLGKVCTNGGIISIWWNSPSFFNKVDRSH